MNSRILTFTALSGMLVAAGCGGGTGSGAGTPALSAAPAVGAAPAIISNPAAKARGSFVASFNIPYSASRSIASSSRSPKYLSPGTTGLTILIGNGSTTTTASATTAGLISVAAVSNPTLTSTTFNSTGAYVAGDTVTVAGIYTSVGGSTLDVFTVTGYAAPLVTGTWAAQGFGSAAIGAATAITAPASIAQTAVIGSVSAPLALQPGTTTKAISGVNGATSTSSVTYSFAPAASAGYYTFSAAFSGFAPGASETIGVVTTDIPNNNFVLSEGQSAAITVPSSGQAVPSTLTLKPVVANIFVPTPTQVSAANVAALTGNPGGIVTAGSLETTVFATDELGYVIPSTSGINDNTASFALTPTTATNLTFAFFSAFGVVPLTNTSLTVFPPGATAAASSTNSAHTALVGITDATSVTGAYLLNILTPGAYSLATNGAILSANGGQVATNSAGNPLSITCGTSSASVAWNAVLTSTTPSTVLGYTLTPGTNYPKTGTSISLTPINCAPGFSTTIN